MKIKEETDTRLVLDYHPYLSTMFVTGFLFVMFAGSVMSIASGNAGAWLFLLFSLVFLGVILCFTSRVRFTIDLTQELSIYRRRTVFKKADRAYKFTDIDFFSVQTTTDSDGPDKHRLAMHLKTETGKRPVPLTILYYTGWSPKQISQRANAWLKKAKTHHAYLLAEKAAANMPPEPKPDVIFE